MKDSDPADEVFAGPPAVPPLLPRDSAAGTAASVAAGQTPPPEPLPVPRKRVVAWALWDWGSASFNAVVTTFVFSTYLASQYFVDPAIVQGGNEDALRAAQATNSTVISTALTIAGVLVALLAPVLGQRSDGTGHRKLWLGINTGVVIAAMGAMFFVEPHQEFLVLGAVLLAVGNVFFEFASVNYNAMLVQVSTPSSIGRVSGFGWGMGYVGGIVLLVVLLLLFLQSFGVADVAGLLGVADTQEGGALSVRLAILGSAIWYLAFAIPVFFAVPEIPRNERRNRVNFFMSYVVLARTIGALAKRSPQVLLFLLASAVFRDGLAAVFTFGAIIASQVFGFTTTEVLYFAVAANLVAGAGTFLGGWLDDRIGPKNLIMISLGCLVAGGLAVLFVGDAQTGFWIAGLFLCLFVGPVQAASRSFLARITPAGREGEIFGLYATTGRAVSFLAPGLFTLFVGLTQDTRLGILGIVVVLAAGLVLMIPVKARPATIAD